MSKSAAQLLYRPVLVGLNTKVGSWSVHIHKDFFWTKSNFPFIYVHLEQLLLTRQFWPIVHNVVYTHYQGVRVRLIMFLFFLQFTQSLHTTFGNRFDSHP